MHSRLLAFAVFTALLLGSAACSDGGGTTDGGEPDANYAPGSQPFLQPCHTAVDCAVPSGADAGVCGAFPNKGGNLCTKACTVAADCPSPSPGCNNMGICMAP